MFVLQQIAERAQPGQAGCACRSVPDSLRRPCSSMPPEPARLPLPRPAHRIDGMPMHPRPVARLPRAILPASIAGRWPIAPSSVGSTQSCDSGLALAQPLRILDVGSRLWRRLAPDRAMGQRTPHCCRTHRPRPQSRCNSHCRRSPALPQAESVGSAADVFLYAPPRPIHLVVSSLFTHHLAEDKLSGFSAGWSTTPLLGWFINDLSRAPIPYHAIRVVRKARAAPSLRAIRCSGLHCPLLCPRRLAEDMLFRRPWCRRLSDSGFKPARLCVARRKPRKPE